MQNKSTDVIQAEDEMWNEFGSSDWISGAPHSQAILMSAKREHRLEKGSPFNGFVLEQKLPEALGRPNNNTLRDLSESEFNQFLEDNSEFTQFIQELKANAHQIPPNTRIQLAVLTRFVDPNFEYSEYEVQGKRKAGHWTAVDLLVGKDGAVSSFVLDAANSYGYRRMHATLKEQFPEGEHYVYQNEIVSDGIQLKPSQIQTQDIGCRVFTVEHLKQLSQIDSATLYGEELPQVATPEGHIQAKNFVGGLKLSRIFRGMQSWTGLRALKEEVKNTPIKEKTGETLIQSAERQSEMVGGFKAIKVNQTISKKNLHYIDKKRNYYQTLSADSQSRIIDDRKGSTFLKNPELFQLNDFLAIANPQAVSAFITQISQDLATLSIETDDSREVIQQCTRELTSLQSTSKSQGAIKNDILLSVSALYKQLHITNHPEQIASLSKTITKLSQNPATRYRTLMSQKENIPPTENADVTTEQSPIIK